MPKKHLLFFITILIHTIHYGQKVWFVTGYDQHFNSNASSIRSNDLFDSIEIKARGIKKLIYSVVRVKETKMGNFLPGTH